ncbi:MAG: ROK family protein [Thermosipho sp. (in: Bacteria)]|nr:ROK family protein [Thermosipho sp. (in: thermotogales)]
MRLNNPKKILLTLLFKGKVYREELLNELKISHSTLTYFINNLISNELISVKTEKLFSAGRPKHLILLNKKNWKSLGIRVGREVVSLTVFDGYFDELEKITVKITKEHLGNKNLDNLLKNILLKLTYKDSIKSIGIAFSGNVIQNKIFSYILKLQNYDPKITINTIFPKSQITILNDVEAIATEEFIKHGGKKILVINYGTGVGACFYESHGIYEKSERKVIELGHFYAGGKDNCYCGGIGCLETIASDYAVLKKAKLIDLNISDFISNEEKFENKLDKIRNLYLTNPEEAEILYSDVFKILSIYVLNLFKLFSPKKIILSGEGVSPWFTEKLQEKLSLITHQKIDVEFRGLKNNIEYGASIDSLREYILNLQI